MVTLRTELCAGIKHHRAYSEEGTAGAKWQRGRHAERTSGSTKEPWKRLLWFGSPQGTV